MPKEAPKAPTAKQSDKRSTPTAADAPVSTAATAAEATATLQVHMPLEPAFGSSCRSS